VNASGERPLINWESHQKLYIYTDFEQVTKKELLFREPIMYPHSYKKKSLTVMSYVIHDT